MTTEQQDKMKDYIGRMSYYNAAEGGSWGAERSGREQLKAAAAIDMLSWLQDGLPLEELQTFVKENRQLSSFSDYLTSSMIESVIGDKQWL